MGFGLSHFASTPYGLRSHIQAPPLIIEWDPQSDSQLPRLAIVRFDVHAEAGIEQLIAQAIFRDGSSEVAYDNQALQKFGDNYWRASAVQSLFDGERILLRRAGGWPSSEFRLHVFARDLDGQETIGQSSFG